jgi:hypothetical protein
MKKKLEDDVKRKQDMIELYKENILAWNLNCVK